MYLPSSFAERDLPTLFGYMEAHPLAALITDVAPEGLFATHLPLLLDRTAGTMGVLAGHVARANPHSRCLAEGPVEALVIFSGPDAYITPGWYQSKQETGRVVPTWNYVVVHAYGALRVREDPQFLRAHLEALTRRHEAKRPEPWDVTDAPSDFIVQQMKAIVGIEITITRLEGKWKMSQNRTSRDIDGVVVGLSGSETVQDREVARIVKQRRPSTS